MTITKQMLPADQLPVLRTATGARCP